MSDSLRPALQRTFNQTPDTVPEPGKIIIACPRCCREMIGGRCVPCENDRRDRFICATLTGLLANPSTTSNGDVVIAAAIEGADRAIAAADAQSK